MTDVSLHSVATSEVEILDRALKRAEKMPEVVSALALLSKKDQETLGEQLYGIRDEMLRRVAPERNRLQSIELDLRENEWTARQLFPSIVAGDEDLAISADRFHTGCSEIITQAREAGVDVPPSWLLTMKPFQQLARETSGAPKRPHDAGGEPSLRTLATDLRDATLSALSATSILDEDIWADFVEPPGKEGDELTLLHLFKGKLERFYGHYQRFERSVSWREKVIRRYLLLRVRDSDYITLIAELESFSLSLENSLLNDAILPEFRRLLNERLTGRNVTRIRVRDAPGLRDPKPEIPTSTHAIRRVQELIRNNMNGMSIGIAGPRGSGKTTLIEGLCTGRVSSGDEEVRRELLGVKVSAPVAYDSREFILHLFAEVCRKTLELKRVPDEKDEQEVGDEPRAALYVICGGFVGGILLVAGIVLTARSIRAEIASNSAIVLASGLTIFAAAVFVILRRQTRRHRRRRISKLRARASSVSLRFEGRLLNADVLVVTLSGVLVSFMQLAAPRQPDKYLGGCVLLALSALPLGIARAFHPQPEDIPSMRIPLENSKSPSWLNACLLWGSTLLFSVGAVMVTLAILGSSISLATIMGYGLALLGWGVLWIIVGHSGPTSGVLLHDMVFEDRLGIQARACLDAIDFQRTFSMERSAIVRLAGTAKLPVGFESQLKSGMSWSKQRQSYPALVDRFNEYIEDLGSEYHVIIGIDELDKLGSVATAENFLNDIKGIFGIRGCYFLVSVSEDAAASFHRRGVPYRDVFDSCFDDIVIADYLNHESAQELLHEKVTDIPAPFVGLCYTLSGGLARDLIRTARSLVDRAGGGINVSAAAAILCQSEGISKARGIQYELSLISGNAKVADLLSLVADMTRGSTSATEYLEWSEVISGWLTSTNAASIEAERGDGRGPDALNLAAELSAFYHFLATVIEFFGDTLGRIGMQSRAEHEKYVGSLDLLASARQSLSVNPRIAVSRAEGFRNAWRS
jgi:hypothetical protein